MALILNADISTSSSAHASESPHHVADSRWHWPLEAPHIVTRNFDPPSQPWLPGHRGVDLQTECGHTVYAPYTGTVSLARRIVDTETVVLTHDFRRSTFSPVISTLPVGTPVKTGQAIGVITHECDKVLHWGVKTGPDTYLNPLTQMVGRIILKPWGVDDTNIVETETPIP